MEKRQGKGARGGWQLGKIALAALVVILAGTSAVMLWQRDRARDRLAESREAARPLLTWLEETLERGGPSDAEESAEEELPLSAAAQLQRAVGGAGSEARAQGFALRAMLPAARELVAEVHEATERLAQEGDAESWPTLMRAYRWLARDARRRRDATAERGFLDRAVELGERRMSAAPSSRAAQALAAALASLAELEQESGAYERSEQQARLALQVLERQLTGERQPATRAALRVQMSHALLVLGDLERARRRRASARGYYERASASARAAGEDAHTPESQRALIKAGLRRLSPELVDAEDEAASALCGETLQQLTGWIASEGGAAARQGAAQAPYRSLAALLDRCPRFPADNASLRWLVERLPATAAPPSLVLRLRGELASAPTEPTSPTATTAPLVDERSGE